MGVHKLWNILEKSGKPIRLETLKNKKLAIDASIWVYQFLKAVRNAKGETLKNSHIIGFFRRIIKLLYFGVLPVFVFDGGAPYLKLNTIKKRREQREGQKRNAKATAQRLLLLQMNSMKNKDSSPSLSLDRELKSMSDSDAPKDQRFRKEDDYHLPTLDRFYHTESDKRVVAKDKYDSYMQSLNLNDIENVDLDNVDPNSEEFNALPLEHQYKLLHTLRVRSRLRMGYSKEQLQELFPNSLDFSKFQIQMVTKRNFLTQKLLNVVGLDENLPNVAVGRINNEMEKAYTLQRMKNGWELSLGENKEGLSVENAIDITRESNCMDDSRNATSNKRKRKEEEKEDSDDDFDEWEDVEIKSKKPRENFSLNSLPLPPANNYPTGNTSLLLANSYVKASEEMPFETKYQQEFQKSLNVYDMENQQFKRNMQETTYISGNEYEKKNNHQYKIDLKKAVEASKQDLNKIREEHEMFLNEDLFEFDKEDKNALQIKDKKTATKAPNDNPPNLSFNFKESIFAKNNHNGTDTSELSTEVFSDGAKEIDERNKQERNMPKKIPDWFDNVTNREINYNRNVHFENEFLRTNMQVTMERETKDSMKKGEDELVKDFHYAEDGKYYKNVKANGDNSVVEDQQVLVLDSESEAEIELIDDDKPQKDQAVVISDEEIKKNTKYAAYGHTQKIEDKMKSSMSTTTENREVEAIIEKAESQNKAPMRSANTKSKIKYYDFEEDEEEQLMEILSKEEELHSDFTTNLKQQYQPTIRLSTNDIQETAFSSSRNFIDHSISIKELEQKKKQQMRDSDEVTDIMIEEVKDLLTCFGIPYVVSPMEAEAQCAILLKLKLVDGIVTDDSDCFLFGGDYVYRHLFVEKKFAELYQMESIREKCDFNREDLISLAYLLGSDYTEGLKGIGPVNAVKILNIFHGDLSKFKAWFDDTTDNKKFYDQLQGSIKEKTASESFLKSLKKRMIKGEVSLDENFPSTEVKNAYLYPEVDEDETEFIWGIPDLDMLRDYLMSHVGWSKQKIDEILIPLMRRYNSPFKVKRR